MGEDHRVCEPLDTMHPPIAVLPGKRPTIDSDDSEESGCRGLPPDHQKSACNLRGQSL